MRKDKLNLGLRIGLHFKRIDGNYIFFDLSADRYFLLANESAERFARFLDNSADASDQYWLLQRRLIAEKVDGHPSSHPIMPAHSSFVDNPCASATFDLVLKGIWAQRQARRELRNRRLDAIFAGLHANAAQIVEGETIYGEVAAAFLRARRYAPAVDQCLSRGIAMKRMLMRRGCNALLVFGVTMPFAAHCWVQVGSTVLTDPLDIALHYDPIFAV